MASPNNKKRSDGKLAFGKDVLRTAKTYQATGKLTSPHKKVSGWDLAARRLRKFLEGDD